MLRDVSAEFATIGLWGPQAREILAAASPDDVDDAALPARRAETGPGRRRDRPCRPHQLCRRTRVGDQRRSRLSGHGLGCAADSGRGRRASSRSGTARSTRCDREGLSLLRDRHDDARDPGRGGSRGLRSTWRRGISSVATASSSGASEIRSARLDACGPSSSARTRLAPALRWRGRSPRRRRDRATAQRRVRDDRRTHDRVCVSSVRTRGGSAAPGGRRSSERIPAVVAARCPRGPARRSDARLTDCTMPFLRRSGGSGATKIFYATDVHGSERTWRKFLNAGAFYGADVLVMGGDVMGKLTIPIIRESNGRYRATVHGRVERPRDDGRSRRRQGAHRVPGDVSHGDGRGRVRGAPCGSERRRSAVRRARDRTTRALDRPRRIEARRHRASGATRPAATTTSRKSWRSWIAPIREHFVGCESRAVQLDDRHIMVSMPYVNPTPWHTPREAPEPELAERIERSPGTCPDYGHAIFNFHAPPSDSTLDTCPQLDWTTDPPSQIVAGRAAGHVRRGQRGRPRRPSSATSRCSASTATSTSRRRRRRLGRTLCVNPGSEYGEGVLRGCLITIADGQVKGYQMTAG